jgi:hypothetical protein
MEKSLYKIDQDLMALLEAIAEQDGEITPEQDEQLAINRYELETKAVDYSMAILQLNAWVEMADKEAKRVTAIKNAYKKTSETLKQRITDAMERYDIREVKDATIKVSLRKSVQTIIDDLDQVPKQYKTIKVETTPDKTAIKKAIQEGEIIEGAHLEEKNNLQIK